MHLRLRPLAVLTLAAGALLACTDGYLDGEVIDDEGLDVGDERELAYVWAPELELEPAPDRPTEPLPRPELEQDDELWRPVAHAAPSGPPHLSLSAHGYTSPCEFGLVAQGFPAVNRDTRRVVHVEYEREQGPSDYDESRVVLVWRDFDDGVERSLEIYDALDFASEAFEAAPRVHCARAQRELEARLLELNALLDAEPLAPMVALPVQLAPGPNVFEDVPVSARGSERPVEVLYHGGELITRVRGLKVLSRRAHPS